ncbi:MAG: hypothetical protein KDA61_13280 [Planctomycetales bacterium]|nr:hypothetical protein [Planctomycetales bacterium]
MSTAHAGNAPLIDWIGDIGAWGNETNWLQGNVPDADSGEGARVANGGTAVVGAQVAPIECLVVEKGRVQIINKQTLGVVQTTEIVGPSATLGLNDGELFSPFTALLDGGAMRGEGRVVGQVVNQGLISPGDANQPFGRIDVDGDLQQGPNGLLEFQIASTFNGEFDQLRVSGRADLGGTLRVIASPDVVIAPGDAFLLMEAAQFTGSFENVQLISNSITKCFGWTCDDSGSLLLECFDVGDMNLDGVVDADDSSYFALALVDEDRYIEVTCGTTGFWIEPYCIGNCDGLNAFDFDDIAAFASQAGLSTAAVMAEIRALQSAVPEPSAAALAGASLLTLHGLRRRRSEADREGVAESSK